jgi:hypothetical protein
MTAPSGRQDETGGSSPGRVEHAATGSFMRLSGSGGAFQA